MNKKGNNDTVPLLVVYITLSLMFLLFIAGMKIHRAAPITGEIFVCIGALCLLLPRLLLELAYVALRKRRRWKIDRRIIRQAKAAGIWDNVNVLAHRALELKAWEAYRIKRESGETDASLRRRCQNVVDRAADKLEMATEKGGAVE